jgi:hypothetical protein
METKRDKERQTQSTRTLPHKALWIEKTGDWAEKVLYEIERKTNLKLYVYCQSWSTALRKIGGRERC